MERRPALALATVGALIAAASALAVSTVLVQEEPATDAAPPTSVAAAVPAPPPTTAGPVDPVIVTQTRDVYDTIVVARVTPAATGDPTATPAKLPSAGSTTTRPPSASGPTTTAPPSTVPPTTVTTRPPGVPSDWPADKPIPPMPPGCRKPQLEDDGEWNCDH